MKKSEGFIYLKNDPYSYEENQLSEYSIDIPYMEEEDDMEKEDKYSFRAEQFLIDLLRQNLKSPPSGSYLKTQWQDGEGSMGRSISYATVLYCYNPKSKRHKDYLHKIEKFIYSDDFDKKHEKDFENSYRKFKEFNRTKRKKKL